MDGTWHPPADAWATTRVGRFGSEHGFDDLDALRDRSIDDPGWFWDAVVQHLGIPFATPYDRGARRLRRHPVGALVHRRPHQPRRRAAATAGPTPTPDAEAIVWEGEEGDTRTLDLRAAARRGRRAGPACSSTAASPPATPSASTCRCSRRRSPPCWRWPSSAPSSCRCSPATAPRPCGCASRTPAPRRSSPPTPSRAAASRCRCSRPRSRPAGDTPTIVVVDRLGTDVGYDDRVARRGRSRPARRSRRGPSTASTRCSSPTRRAPPAGPRAWCTSTAGGR